MPALKLPVLPLTSHDEPQARVWAGRLGLEILPCAQKPENLEQWPLLLAVSGEGLQVRSTGKGAPGPVMADFLSGAVAHRRRFGGGKGQQIAKAIGLQGSIRPSIADVTAGLGRDSFVLATLGCDVEMVERSPIVGALLEDAMIRAAGEPEVAAIVDRMRLYQEDAIAWMRRRRAEGGPRPEVVYLDPMFPHSQKSALVKKEMRVFRHLVGDDTDAQQLLAEALETAECRVVVKRPRKAPFIEGRTPSYSLEGKSGRFDIYALKRLERH